LFIYRKALYLSPSLKFGTKLLSSSSCQLAALRQKKTYISASFIFSQPTFLEHIPGNEHVCFEGLFFGRAHIPHTTVEFILSRYTVPIFL
jgi:hypothetical protein